MCFTTEWESFTSTNKQSSQGQPAFLLSGASAFPASSNTAHTASKEGPINKTKTKTQQQQNLLRDILHLLLSFLCPSDSFSPCPPLSCPILPSLSNISSLTPPLHPSLHLPLSLSLLQMTCFNPKYCSSAKQRGYNPSRARKGSENGGFSNPARQPAASHLKGLD